MYPGLSPVVLVSAVSPASTDVEDLVWFVVDFDFFAFFTFFGFASLVVISVCTFDDLDGDVCSSTD